MIQSKRWLLPDGVDELMPAQAQRLESARRSVLDFFRSGGFSQIQPPLVEFEDSLLIGLGDDVAAQSMRLTDQVSGRPMALRADVSSQAARMDAHSMHAEGTNRLCYVEPVVHAKPRSQWASRSPLMAGAEIFGCEKIDSDIEIILQMLGTLRTVEAAFVDGGEQEPLELTLDLGHVAIGRALVSALQDDGCDSQGIELIRAALQRKSRPDLQLLVSGHVNSEELRALIMELPLLCGDQSILERARTRLGPIAAAVQHALIELDKVISVVHKIYPQLKFYCDLAETRGYDYHTGIVFAVYSKEHGSALANGGRYDGVGEVFGRYRPATGFNADLKALRRLFEVRCAEDSSSQVCATENPIAAPSLNGGKIEDSSYVSSLWQTVSSLREQGEIVVFVETEEINKFNRCLVLQGKSWNVVGSEGV